MHNDQADGDLHNDQADGDLHNDQTDVICIMIKTDCDLHNDQANIDIEIYRKEHLKLKLTSNLKLSNMCAYVYHIWAYECKYKNIYYRNKYVCQFHTYV